MLIHENEVLGAGAFATVYRSTIIGTARKGTKKNKCSGKIPLLKAVAGASTALENQDGRTEVGHLLSYQKCV